MNQLVKPKRIRDKKYLEFLKTKICRVNNQECWGDNVPAHLDSVGSFGSDFSAIVLCVGHHTGGLGVERPLHSYGSRNYSGFEKEYSLNLYKEARELNEEYFLMERDG